jgi:NAD(P)-dependent dehydrogenase (short-subunit alcohol dehydrogenase family)
MAVVVITGAGSGIGLATAVHFAAKGDTVFATMRDPAKAGDLLATARSASVEVSVRALDVTDEASVETAVAEIRDRTGGIDLLVNNAGVTLMSSWEQATMAEIEGVLETNFFGTVRCAKAVIPGMRQQRSGAIVNVGSVVSRVSPPIQGVYNASKFAVLAFTESLALELRQFGVHVAAVLPGFFRTPILERAWAATSWDESDPYDDLLRRWSQLYAGARVDGGDPADVAAAIEMAAKDTSVISRLVGDDAEAFAAARARMGDEGFLRYGETQSDEAWFARFQADLSGQ